MTDLKPLDQWSTAEHVNYVRRNNGRRGNPNPDRGRPPLVGEGGPTREELAAAGLRGKADPNQRGPHAYSTALDSGRDAPQRAIRNGISRLEQDLAYAVNAKSLNRIDGVPREEYIARTERGLARQKDELASAVEARAAADQARRERLADEDARERAAGPGPGHGFLGGDDVPEWRFDDRGRPVERIGRRGPSGHDEAA